MGQIRVWRGVSIRNRRVAVRGAGPGMAVGRRERRKVVTRQELVEAGRRLFGSKGLYDSKVEDLTRSAGIAKGTFYQYFDDKEALILAVVREAFAELGREMERRSRGARTVGARAERIAGAHVAFFAANPDLVRVLHQVRGLVKYRRRGSGALRRELLEHLRGVEGILGGTADGRRIGRSRRRELAELLFGGVSGVFSVRLTIADVSRAPRALVRLSRLLGALARAFAREGVA